MDSMLCRYSLRKMPSNPLSNKTTKPLLPKDVGVTNCPCHTGCNNPYLFPPQYPLLAKPMSYFWRPALSLLNPECLGGVAPTEVLSSLTHIHPQVPSISLSEACPPEAGQAELTWKHLCTQSVRTS